MQMVSFNVNASKIAIVLEMMKVGYCCTEWEGENSFLKKQLHLDVISYNLQ